MVLAVRTKLDSDVLDVMLSRLTSLVEICLRAVFSPIHNLMQISAQSAR